MKEVKKYPAGTFSWVDLMTTDQPAAKKFYSTLFGWHINDMPMGPDSVYTMLELEGKSVAALSQMSPEQQEQGMPPVWNSYITVDNADKSAAKAKSLGGTIVAEPFDVFDAGRMAVIQDPTGAIFSVWQPKTHIGASYVNYPNCLTWNELATTDREKANAFYEGLFGWTRNDQDMGDGVIYTSFMNNGRMNGGMMQMTEEWGGAPSHWMVYFAVEDVDASAAKVKELGGQVHVGPQDIPDTGRFAMVQDPQGAMFSIIKLNQIDEPPQG